MRLHINLPGYEDLKVELNSQGEIASYQLQCSVSTLEFFEDQLKNFGRELAQWPLPTLDETTGRNKEKRRSYLLMLELVLRARGEWGLPYEGETVCICREVSSEKIDQSIAAGAGSVETVALWTTACTSCTSCKGKIEEILKHRLGQNHEVGSTSSIRKISK